MISEDKIKDKSKASTVKAYQNQIKLAIETIRSKNESINSQTENYIKILEENIKRAPFVLGWLYWPGTKKK